jgi:uncharacterized protein YjcR
VPPVLEKQPSGEILALQKLEPIRRARLPLKSRGGAPKGNRNAFKHGGFTREKLEQRRALHSEVRTLILRMRVTMAQIMLATVGRRPKITVTRIEL